MGRMGRDRAAYPWVTRAAIGCGFTLFFGFAFLALPSATRVAFRRLPGDRTSSVRLMDQTKFAKFARDCGVRAAFSTGADRGSASALLPLTLPVRAFASSLQRARRASTTARTPVWLHCSVFDCTCSCLHWPSTQVLDERVTPTAVDLVFEKVLTSCAAP
jgi:hypothetical protein